MATRTTDPGHDGRPDTGGVESDLTPDLANGFLWDRKPGLTAAPTSDRRPSLLARVLLAFLAVYRATAVFRQPRCRFSPTCSTYAVESVQVHGALRGSLHAVRRISRCHPWNPGGSDPVPPRK